MREGRAAVLVGFSFFWCFGCAQDAVVFYEVTTTRTEECAIRSNGEFCSEEEQFDPPVFDVWSVEVTPEVSRLVADQEVWVLDPLKEGEDPFATPRTSTRRSIVTEGNGPCTTTKTEALRFQANGVEIAGTLDTTSVLEGPEACGNTPTGERTANDIAGSSTTADGFPVSP